MARISWHLEFRSARYTKEEVDCERQIDGGVEVELSFIRSVLVRIREPCPLLFKDLPLNDSGCDQTVLYCSIHYSREKVRLYLRTIRTIMSSTQTVVFLNSIDCCCAPMHCRSAR